jgi:phosphoribosyl 1,2-cyclic phosphodiesterase
MFIRCWGARGSIPVSGRDYQKYGGDTPCMEIRTSKNSVLIIDAGTGIRRLGNLLLSEKKHVFTMLFTHVHWDHIIGLPFFKPIFKSGTQLSIYGCPFERASFRDVLSPVIQEPYFPVNFENLKAGIRYADFCEGTLQIDDMKIISIPLSHPNRGLGYRFEENGRSFVFLTDNELGHKHPGGLEYKDYQDFAKGADLLVHDAEYLPEEYSTDNQRWGHSSYLDALRLAMDAKVARFGLYHHNQDRKDADIDRMVEDSQKRASGSRLECFAMAQDMEISL